MCRCPAPNVNGQPGYRYGDEPVGVRPDMPVEPTEHERVYFAEPGRCGGKVDNHSHSVALLLRHGEAVIACRHGGGTERFSLGYRAQDLLDTLSGMDSGTRYNVLLAIWSACAAAAHKARRTESERWRSAVLEKRIKRRKGSLHLVEGNTTTIY